MKHCLLVLVLVFLGVGISNARAQVNELELPDVSAFALGTTINVESVNAVEADSFNARLRAAQEKGETWAKDPIQIALQFVGGHLSGSRQLVTAEIGPGEWEEGRDYAWARVVLEANGWLDDSRSGERYVLWLVPDAEANLAVQRALWAQLCERMHRRFYSAAPCP